MSNLNTNTAVSDSAPALWRRAFATLGSAGAGALAVVLALAFLPPTSEFASGLLGPAIPSALASSSSNGHADSRGHRIADAIAVQHGTYLSDPYGCVYVAQYLDAKLSLTPVLDEQRQPLCQR